MKSTYEEKSDYSFISQNYGLITRFLLEPIIDAFYNLVNKVKLIEKKPLLIQKMKKVKKIIFLTKIILMKRQLLKMENYILFPIIQ
jgi:hypothetical protein